MDTTIQILTFLTDIVLSNGKIIKIKYILLIPFGY